MVEPVIIGSAQLYLGDCKEILPQLPKVDACVTDPPYGMGYRSNHRKEKHAAIAGDGATDMLEMASIIPVSHSRYVFARWENLRDVTPKSCITWVKNNWTAGDLEHAHSRMTELILFWPGPDHVWAGKRPTDVVRHARVSSARHPTEKPVPLMMEVVGWTSGCVVDPFMGVGWTGVACVNLGRKFIGIEIDRKYFDIACERIARAYDQARLPLGDAR